MTGLCLGIMADTWIMVETACKQNHYNLLNSLYNEFSLAITQSLLLTDPMSLKRGYFIAFSYDLIDVAFFLKLKHLRYNMKKLLTFGVHSGDPYQKSRDKKQENMYLEGFKISMAGRLTRKERASSF